jgi:hypothetical protein
MNLIKIDLFFYIFNNENTILLLNVIWEIYQTIQ